MNERPDFSGIAREYAAVRPGYPPELFQWLAAEAPAREAAWDVATGSGQAAIGLAGHFARVVATDVSARQIEHARPHPRIEYRVAAAEESGLESNAYDLVTVAAAVHWFDLERFGREVRRVLRPGGVVAAWTYHVARITAPLGAIFAPFYHDVRPYFAPRAREVDAGYEAIALPGERLAPPPFHATVRWTAEQALAFVRTWSGVQACLAATGRDPVIDLEPAVRRALGDDGRAQEFQLPLFVRVSRVD